MIRNLIGRIKQAFYRQPDFIIGRNERPYMLRWFVIPRNAWFNIYLHKVCRDDDDRALHDHPWPSLSLILTGRYVEVTPRGRRTVNAGSVVLRSAEHQHRLELLEGRPCWTLFITGPRVREWGFHCPKGWVHWKRFVSEDDHGNIGRGCGEAD